MGGDLYGRSREQELLATALAALPTDGARAFVIEGDPGIGKTALVEWLVRRADGCTVLRFRGHEADTGFAYLALRRIVRPIAAHLDELDPPLADALRSALGFVADQADEPIIGLALIELLSLASERQPVLIVIDDAHLIDDASARALSFAARRLVPEPVMMLFGVRPREIPAPEIYAGVETIPLRPLDAAASRELLESEGLDLTPQLADRAKGNPLALRYFARAESPTPDDELTERLRWEFARTIHRLPEPTQRALALISLAGEIDDSVRAAALDALGITDDDIHVAIDGGVLTPDCDFVHPLIREAATPTGSDAAETHLALADAWAGHDDDCALLHRLHAGGDSAAHAVDDACRRADTLAAEGHLDDAIELFTAAAPSAPPGDPRAAVWLAAARLAGFAGRYAQALPLYEAALRNATTPRQRLLAQRSLAWIRLWTQSTGRDAAAELRNVLVQLPDGAVPDDELSYAWGSLVALSLQFDIHATLAAIAEAPPGMVPPSDEFAALLIGNLPASSIDMDRLEQLAAASTGDAPTDGDWSGATEGELLLLLGRWRRADQSSREYLDTLRRHNVFSETPLSITRRVIAQTFLGDAVAAYGLALAGLERAPDDMSLHVAAALVGAVVGSPNVEEWVEHCLTRGRRHGLNCFISEAHHRLVLRALADDDIDAAAAHAHDCWAVLAEFGFRHPGYAVCRGDLAEAFARSGAHDAARDVIAELETSPYDVPWARGVAARARGILGDDGAFDSAIELLAESPWEVARTRLSWARALVVAGAATAGDARRAAELAEHAARDFDAMGARPWATQARSVARAATGLGDAAAPEAPDPLAVLTQREQAVALAVMSGQSNKQVARELFISLKTVEAHLQQVYRKLDVRSRTQLSALYMASRA